MEVVRTIGTDCRNAAILDPNPFCPVCLGGFEEEEEEEEEVAAKGATRGLLS